MQHACLRVSYWWKKKTVGVTEEITLYVARIHTHTYSIRGGGVRFTPPYLNPTRSGWMQGVGICVKSFPCVIPTLFSPCATVPVYLPCLLFSSSLVQSLVPLLCTHSPWVVGGGGGGGVRHVCYARSVSKQRRSGTRPSVNVAVYGSAWPMPNKWESRVRNPNNVTRNIILCTASVLTSGIVVYLVFKHSFSL